jgi:glucose/mannose-6-phosphate isomerase
MLDDLKYIHERDSEDALGIAEKSWQQLEHKFDTASQVVKADNIVYAGMGGSALAALISTSWPGYDRPFEIVRNYHIPAYVSKNTFFIASSYSGNTEETLSALDEAMSREASIAVITSGGKLADIARAQGYPLALLPGGIQPRYAVFYGLKALMTLLVGTGLVESSVETQLQQTVGYLSSKVSGLLPSVATSSNRAKQIALDCVGKSVVIYGGTAMYPAAYKWKINFNENAKQIAWVNQFPEFNHNEMLGWTKQPIDKPYKVIELISDLEHPRIQKRFEVASRLLSGSMPEPLIVKPEGSTLLDQLLGTIVLGDFVSLYCSLLNGLDPTPVELIEKFKKALE